MKLVSAAAMRALDERTIREAGVPGFTLMERAGTGAARAFLEAFPALAGRPVGVLCGKGNNGGDGLVIARVLAGRGIPATAFVLGRKEDLHGDPERMLHAALGAGVRVDALEDEEALEEARSALVGCAGIVDALFGTGLERPVEGLPRRAIALMNELRSGRPVLAVDVPSGVDATTGAILGDAVHADLTVTFGLPKLGHVLFPGAARTGRLVVFDIGIPAEYVEQAGLCESIVTHTEAREALPERPLHAHKGTFGHLLVLAGSPGKTGAAAMASLAAMRCGTGLVTLGAPESLNTILSAKLTEVMCEPLPETDARTLGAKALERVFDLLEGKTAIAIGPGISTHPETRDLVLALVRECPVPMVLDADALTAIAGQVEVLERARGSIVLTPHPGEMGRLTGMDAAKVNLDRVGVARGFATRHRVVLVLKGAHTIVASPDGLVAVNLTGNPGMASGGMGDALTGIVGGFLAQGVDAVAAARLGAYLHGRAGDRAAREQGMVGFLASDLIDQVPRTIHALQAGPGDAPF